MYKKRFYRTKTYNGDLVAFIVRHFESNLQIYAHSNLSDIALEYLRDIHGQVRSLYEFNRLREYDLCLQNNTCPK